MIKLEANHEDRAKILAIAAKADGLLRMSNGFSRIGRLQVAISLTACHLNGCPLDLDGLLYASDFNLLHDVIGIHTNINQEDGSLENCFSPRYAIQTEAPQWQS